MLRVSPITLVETRRSRSISTTFRLRFMEVRDPVADLVELAAFFSTNLVQRLEPVNHLVASMASIGLNEEVNIVGPNCQGANPPITFASFLMYYLSQPIRNFGFEYLRPWLRAPQDVALHYGDRLTASAI